MLAVVYGYRKEWRCPATMAFFVRITIQQQTSPRRLSSVPQLLGFAGTVSWCRFIGVPPVELSVLPSKNVLFLSVGSVGA